MMLACGCPSRYPEWDDQDIDLSCHCVLSHSIPTLMHMPLGYESYLQRQQEEVSKLELPERWPGFTLTQTGMIRGRILRLLENVTSPSRHVEFLPSPFELRARLHSGDIGTIRTTVRTMQAELFDAGKLPKELYLSYLTCPACQKSRGGIRVMVLRRWVTSPRLMRKLKKSPS